MRRCRGGGGLGGGDDAVIDVGVEGALCGHEYLLLCAGGEELVEFRLDALDEVVCWLCDKFYRGHVVRCGGCGDSRDGQKGGGVVEQVGCGRGGEGGGLLGECWSEGVWFVCWGIEGEVSCGEEGGVVGGDIEYGEGACGEFPSVDQAVEWVEGHDVEGCCVWGSGEGVCRGDGASPVGVGCVGGDGDFFGSGVQHSCAEHRS